MPTGAFLYITDTAHHRLIVVNGEGWFIEVDLASITENCRNLLEYSQGLHKPVILVTSQFLQLEKLFLDCLKALLSKKTAFFRNVFN